MQVYVNQHDFFINRVRESDTQINDELYVAFLYTPPLSMTKHISDGNICRIQTLVCQPRSLL